MRPITSETTSENGLTGDSHRIQCSATDDTPDEGYSETDMIVIRNFLDTLAEVALAVVARQTARCMEEHD